MREYGLEVRGAGSENDLMAVDLLAFDHESNIAEFFLIEDRDEVLLEIVVVAGTHHVVGVSMVLCAGSFFGDGGKTAGANVLETFVR